MIAEFREDALPPSTQRIEQLDQLVEATDITLADEDVAYLEELYQPMENLLSVGRS